MLEKLRVNGRKLPLAFARVSQRTVKIEARRTWLAEPQKHLAHLGGPLTRHPGRSCVVWRCSIITRAPETGLMRDFSLLRRCCCPAAACCWDLTRLGAPTAPELAAWLLQPLPAPGQTRACLARCWCPRESTTPAPRSCSCWSCASCPASCCLPFGSFAVTLPQLHVSCLRSAPSTALVALWPVPPPASRLALLCSLLTQTSFDSTKMSCPR